MKKWLSGLKQQLKTSMRGSTVSTESSPVSVPNIIELSRRVIDREYQYITQPFSPTLHKGVDLRCVDDETMRNNLDVVAPERMRMLRQGKDGYGNYFLVCSGLESGYQELKFIHIAPTEFPQAYIFVPGEYISKCILGGNSYALHLHFETWNFGRQTLPDAYFEKMNIKYKYRGER